jgi:UDP-4-amino-4,6-dideoxy-N-acetyl-beta-L-altrosamine transaminase
VTPHIIPYGRQSIDDADVAAVERVLRGDWLTQGPAVEAFEEALCTALDSPWSVAVNSGTAALHVGMLAMGIGEGDLVIVPPITFAASGNAARYCGAEVAFVDVEPDTALLDADALDRFLIEYRGPLRPRAVVAVHYAGLPADLLRLARVCEAHGIALIEDACHAPGATWTDDDGTVRKVGSGTVSAFTALSFHPVKHLTTGEGGALLTRDPKIAEGARLFRSHGITRDPARVEANEGPWWYEMQALGFNYRLPDVLAALGTSQLAKQTPWLARRRAIAARYRQAFSDCDQVGMQAERAGREHAYHLFPVLVEDRKAAYATLHAAGIRAQVHYIPVHQLPYYRARYGAQHFPHAEAWYARELSIPMFPAMTDADVDIVIANVRALRA